ncbi:hypothetical protein POM88_033034 [Heracleum sosnowskyi]|uniref:Uncharacterized protein n=1 Tax=Heracleum sosnowskyi TaxID=360622 RepID=A0AAD8I1L9_9APIA|nr:hypothetical protein POM88_033034 [Heracleum sosnowskyi]
MTKWKSGSGLNYNSEQRVNNDVQYLHQGTLESVAATASSAWLGASAQASANTNLNEESCSSIFCSVKALGILFSTFHLTNFRALFLSAYVTEHVTFFELKRS